MTANGARIGAAVHRGVLAAVLTGLAAAAPLAAAAQTALQSGSRPNIVLIVADDLGYQDLGLYGAEIRTPNIDALGRSGVILTNFYASVACQPTRAMLMSGADNHLAGVGTMSRVVEGNPYYEGRLSDRVVSMAQRLHDAGYGTYMVGKWNLGGDPGQIPVDRGFDHAFALMEPGASHFDDGLSFTRTEPATYMDDHQRVTQLPTGFYSTVGYTDRMLSYLDEAAQEDAPFFAYVAYTAPHWPHQALDEDMAKVRGRYDEGWDVIRQRRFQKWKDLGYAPADAEEPALIDGYRPWDSYSPDEQETWAAVMEAYAAMVERMDSEIGRLVDRLRESGELDNTLIVFMSDNGASAAGALPVSSDGSDGPATDNSVANIGRPGSWVFTGPGWGEAGAASFWLAKGAMADGGIHVPAFVTAPGLGLKPGRSDALVAAFDLAPTFVDLAGGDMGVPEGDYVPMTGRSFAALLRGEDGARDADVAVAFETAGQRAVRRGDWKALMMPARGQQDGAWTLFNVRADPGEREDVAAANPQVLAELVAAWDDYAEANGVAPPAPPRRGPPAE